MLFTASDKAEGPVAGTAARLVVRVPNFFCSTTCHSTRTRSLPSKVLTTDTADDRAEGPVAAYATRLLCGGLASSSPQAPSAMKRRET